MQREASGTMGGRLRYWQEAVGGVLAGTAGLVTILVPLALVALAPLAGMLVSVGWPDNGSWMALGSEVVIALFGFHAFCTFKLARGPREIWKPPAGWEPLSWHQAPLLFAELDAMTMTVSRTVIGEIYVSGECNAAIAMHGDRRKGITLMVGMPLLLMMSPAELRAVVAHELGHLNGMRGVISRLLRRLLIATDGRRDDVPARLYPRLIQAVFAWIGRLSGPFATQAWNRLSRSQEHRADWVAARIAGSATTVDALRTLEWTSRWLQERWWPPILAKAASHPEPCGTPFTALLEASVDVGGIESLYWLDEAILCPPPLESTHPSLRARSRMLLCDGGPPPLPWQVGASTLGAQLPTESAEYLCAALDLFWLKDVADVWRERAAKEHSNRQECNKLLCRRDSQLLPVEEHMRLACLQRIMGDAAWRQTLDAVLAGEGTISAEARMAAVEHDLERGEHRMAAAQIDRCIGHSVELDRRCRRLNLRLLRLRNCTTQELAAAQHAVWQDARQASVEEREWSAVNDDAWFVPFDLTEDFHAHALGSLRRVRAAARSVHLVQQRSVLSPERWRWVVVVIPGEAWHETLSRRLRISDSHQHARCAGLLEAALSEMGAHWAGIVRMPGSRLAGRIRRGKAHSQLL